MGFACVHTHAHMIWVWRLIGTKSQEKEKMIFSKRRKCFAKFEE
jgi:hypothetical protein